MRCKLFYLIQGSIIATLLGTQAPAWAIVINDGVGAAGSIALGTAVNGAGAVVDTPGCTGTLITTTHVMTAQHCTFGSSMTGQAVRFHTNNDGVPDFTATIASKSELDGTNVLLDGTDVAILTLNAAVSSAIATPMAFAGAGLVNVGDLVTTVGFGFNGVGSTGHGFTSSPELWGAQNILDAIGPALNPGGAVKPNTANILNTDFDNGTAPANTLSPGIASSAVPVANEGTTAPGDSGGPLIINGLITAVLSDGSTSNSTYGDISWWTGTFAANIRSWILATTGGAAVFVDSLVPAPGTLALALLGLLCLRWNRGKRQAAR